MEFLRSCKKRHFLNPILCIPKKNINKDDKNWHEWTTKLHSIEDNNNNNRTKIKISIRNSIIENRFTLYLKATAPHIAHSAHSEFPFSGPRVVPCRCEAQPYPGQRERCFALRGYRPGSLGGELCSIVWLIWGDNAPLPPARSSHISNVLSRRKGQCETLDGLVSLCSVNVFIYGDLAKVFDLELCQGVKYLAIFYPSERI